MALAMVKSRPSVVESAAASPPAMTRPVITNGSPATSGMESTTKSVDRTTKSAHWTMPSPFLSTTVKRPAGCQKVTQLGSSLILDPTSRVKTAKRAKAAYAGAVKYRRKMKNSDHATEVRACLTDGVV